MGLIFGRRRRPAEERDYWGIAGPGDMIPRRMGGSRFGQYGMAVTAQTAMQNSVVWAALRLRADLVSTMPFDAYRMATIDDAAGPQKIDAPASPFMNDAAFLEFIYSSQVELDRSGNSIGIIHEVDGRGLPTEIELVPSSVCDLVIRNRKLAKYRIYGDEYDPAQVWHEKQFTASGLHVGMSPIAYSAYQSGLYRSVQEFAAEWFMSGQGPRASLKNVNKRISPKEALVTKEAWRASQEMGEPFVHGNDWEYNLIQAQSASTDWLESQRLTSVDLSRFFGSPADLLDAATAGGPNITYANVTQRNLQFLIMHLGPAIRRREVALSQLLPRPRFIEFDTDALLRMDPLSRAEWIKTRIEARELCPSEARAMDNRKPYTDDQVAEFELLGLNKTATGALTGAMGLPVPAGTQTKPGPPAAPGPAQDPAQDPADNPDDNQEGN
jgi:HK97 family phage portal protein